MAELLRRALRGVRRNRRTAVAHMARGVCYGLGTGVVSLAVFWVQKRV
ncbi:hypothetical protein [Streptomyces sp. ODS28]